SRRRFAARLNSGVRPHMKVLAILLAMLCCAMASCASTPELACQNIAPASSGWQPIPVPANAADLLELAGTKPDTEAPWFQKSPRVLRACTYSYCGSVGYDFEHQDGVWSGGLNVLTTCH